MSLLIYVRDPDLTGCVQTLSANPFRKPSPQTLFANPRLSGGG